MSKKTKKTTKTGRGGARAGAGRKQLYGAPLDDAFTARVNDEQGAAIGDWCRKNRVAPATLLREVGLSHAAPRLGLGVEAVKKTVEKEVVLDSASCFPVKCTSAQGAAIRAHCDRKGVAPGTWLREAALEYIGKAKLGLRGAAAALDKSL